MLIAVDHLRVRVEDVAHASETYRRLGFDVINARAAAFVLFGDFHIEFRESKKTQERPGGGGCPRIVFRSDNIDSDVARIRSHGNEVTDPVDDPLQGSDGLLARRTALVLSNNAFGLVEHRHSTSERSAAIGEVTDHPNTSTVVERIYVAVDSIDRELPGLEKLLGMTAPEPEMGTVIMSLMSVFYIGGIGIAVAEPRGQGPTASALAASGPGVFQVLLRARHLDQAVASMAERGVPPPSRGTRLSGESALLVEPENACNVYVAFAGPA